MTAYNNMPHTTNLTEEPLISIIVPVYNVKEYLSECLSSIIKQTYRNLEIIVIDDESTDGSLEICREFADKDNRITLLPMSHAGVSAARNLGLEKATGEYVSFVDSDDFADADMYEYLFRILKENDADISACTYTNEGKGRKNVPELYTGKLHLFSNKEIINELVDDRLVKSYVWGKLYKKELFDGIQFPDGKYFEDIAISCMIYYKAKRIAFSCVPKYHYRTRATSITGNYVPLRKYHCFLAWYERDKFLLGKDFDDRCSVKLTKRGIHEVSHMILCPQTPELKEMERDILRKVKEKKDITYKQIGIFMAIKRYFLFSHYKLYSKSYRAFRSIFRCQCQKANVLSNPLNAGQMPPNNMTEDVKTNKSKRRLSYHY